MGDKITQLDVQRLRAGAAELLHLGTRLLGSKEHQEKYIDTNKCPDFVKAVRMGEPVGGTEAVRTRALNIIDVSDKIERKLFL